MSGLLELFKRLPKAKTPADYEAVLADAEKQAEAARARLADLESRREDVIFAGGDLAKLTAEITAAEQEIKTLAVTIEGARKRHLAAIDAEHQALLEAEDKKALELQAELIRRLGEFATAATAVTDQAERIVEIRRILNPHNARMVENGRRDLVLRDPMSELSGRVGRQVHDPLHNLYVAEFWPRHPDGPALLQLAK